AVAHAALINALVERVSRDRFAEHDGIALNDPASALRALRRELFDLESFKRPTLVAGHATKLRSVAVDLGDRLTAGDLVQIVDVLCDDVLEPAHLLEVAKGEVARIRDSRIERLGKFGEAAGALLSHLPPALRVLDEALIVPQVGLAVLRPEALRPAKRGHAAFRRQSRPDQRHNVPRESDQARRQFDGVVQSFGPVALSISRGHSATTLTSTVRSRGPSNSARKIPCQRPSASRPFSTGIAADCPTRLALMCACALPSACR